MKNIDRISRFNCWLKKSLSVVGVAGISVLIGLPALSQSQSYYPPMAFFQPLAYPNYPQKRGTEASDVLDNVENNTNLQNLAAEIEAAGLTEEFQQQDITVLAPTDEAFNALPDEIIDKLSIPENRLKVLQYHLIAGQVSEEDLDRGKIETSGGQEITVSNKDNLTFNNDVRAINVPTVANNGVIIEIDRVLLPPDF